MKRASLNIKLMTAFIGAILFFLVVSYVLLIESFNKYYYEDIYKVLEDNSDSAKVITDIQEFINSSNKDNRSIERIYWIKTNGVFERKTKESSNNLTEDIIKKIEDSIIKQTQFTKRYSISVEGRKLFYIINKYETNSNMLESEEVLKDQKGNDINTQNINTNKNGLYRATLRWEPLDDSLKKQLYRQLYKCLLIAFLAMLIVFFFLSGYITRPLVKLTKSVKRISNRKFDKPIDIDRNDEIGFLAKTIEDMRRELLAHDENQKFRMHAISHELKTPTMIIQSYIDALKRGIFPKGSKQASLDVIDEECKRLQKLVSNLLYIQRLDYIDSEIKHREEISLKKVIEEVSKNMLIEIMDIEVKLKLKDVKIPADYNHIKIIVENILNNQIRYAKSIIKISIKNINNKIVLEFYNDGDKLVDKENIFDIFKKGTKGQTGLGLYIVKRLVTINGGNISAHNEAIGVTFRIEWQIDKIHA
ncbi:HAMP domain-containing sensor histidine kinase [Clostridiaceae bacterium M8S5]|nr:HAMP domain-containing sensor histidine kinase [Clostridiaceae bacterium M8S5]